MSGEKLVFSILLAAAFCHFLNDMVQSLIPAIYPMLKNSFHLDFGQIGLITLTYQITASLLQPLIGHFNDRHPRPYSLAIGMGFTLIGLVTLSRVSTYPMLLVRRGAGGHRIGGISSRVLPRGAHGLGRTAWFRASVLSSGRQRRIVVRPAAGGVHRAAQRPVQPGMVFGGRSARHRGAGASGFLVEEEPAARAENPAPARRNIIPCYRRARSTCRSPF